MLATQLAMQMQPDSGPESDPGAAHLELVDPDPPAAPDDDGAWIEVEFLGEDADLAAEILADLRALLEGDGIVVALAPPPGAGSALASVTIQLRAGETVSATVDIRDALTDKRIARDLDLTYIPADGHSLGVASATAELLDASWAEIATRHWQAPTEDTFGEIEAPSQTPAAVRDRVEDTLTPARSRIVGHRISFGASGGWTSGGLGMIGGGLDYELRFVERVGIEIGGLGLGVLGPRLPAGRVSGGAGLGRAGLNVSAKLRGRFDLDVGASARVGQVVLLGRSDADGAVRSASAIVVEAGAVVRPSVYVRPHLRLELPIWIGTVLRGVAIRDAGEADFGLRGLSVGASLAVAWTTWTFAPRRRAG